jgi:hypothetical protein
LYHVVISIKEQEGFAFAYLMISPICDQRSRMAEELDQKETVVINELLIAGSYSARGTDQSSGQEGNNFQTIIRGRKEKSSASMIKPWAC